MSHVTVWQIGCGEQNRRYDRLFLEHDIMALGPGRYGPYRPELYEDGQAGKDYTPAKIGTVRQIATEVKPGDIVLARTGKRIVGIGLAAAGYQHRPEFDDVAGWDLEHTHRVIWQDHLSKELATIQKRRGDLFKGRKQIPTFTMVRDSAVLGPIKDLLTETRERKLRPLPSGGGGDLDPTQFANELFRAGLSYDASLQVERAVRKLRGLLSWYDENRGLGRPQEHEVVAHMILPMMLALGWSEQLLAIEWKRIDLAAFIDTPTTAKSCGLVCEAKGMKRPLENTVHQAKRYCTDHKLTSCRKILVADGGRFYLYCRRGKEWEAEPSGYINLRKLRRAYLLPKGTDAVRTLMALTPAHVGR